MQQIVDDMPVGELTNTDKDSFWYTSPDAEFGGSQRYHHETGKRGDVFYDGNNDDKWQVVAINTEHNRAIVQNKSQGGMRLVYWS